MAINTTPPEGYVPASPSTPQTPTMPTPPGAANSPAPATSPLPGLLSSPDTVRNRSNAGGMNQQVYWPLAPTGTAGSTTVVNSTIVEGGGGGGGTTSGVISVSAIGTAEITATVTLPYTTPLITLTSVAQSAATVWAGPVTGSAATPGFRALVVSDLPTSVGEGSSGVTVDGAGATPITGSKGYVVIPYNCTIAGWTVIANQSGSCAFDIQKATSWSSITSMTSIVASAPPSLSASQANASTTLTGWTTTLSSGNVLQFLLSSVSTLKRVTLELQLQRT